MKVSVCILLILCIYSTNSNSCGGNCPDGDCPSCPCGTSKSSYSITNYCNKYALPLGCCTCIINQLSKGNRHYVEYNDPYYSIGMLPVDEVNFINNTG